MSCIFTDAHFPEAQFYKRILGVSSRLQSVKSAVPQIKMSLRSFPRHLQSHLASRNESGKKSDKSRHSVSEDADKRSTHHRGGESASSYCQQPHYGAGAMQPGKQ